MKKTILALAFVASSSVFADVKGGKLGIDFSYSGSTPSFGVWWHVADMVALKPSIGWTNTDTNTPATPTETVASNIVLGLGVPIYLAKFNALNLYVSPAFSYTISSTKVTNAAGTTTGSGSTLGISASLGLQVQLIDQVHVFGELGFGYSKLDPGSGTTVTTLGTARTSIGAIFYFN